MMMLSIFGHNTKYKVLHGFKEGLSRLNGRLCVVVEGSSSSSSDNGDCGVAPTERVTVVLARNWCRKDHHVWDPNDSASRFVVHPDNLKSPVRQQHANANLTCSGCGDVFDEPKFLLCCSQCKAAFYCSKECQKKDWDGGHKMSCDFMRKARRDRNDDSKLSEIQPLNIAERYLRIRILRGAEKWTEMAQQCRSAITAGYGHLRWLHVYLALALWEGVMEGSEEEGIVHFAINGDEILSALSRARELPDCLDAPNSLFFPDMDSKEYMILSMALMMMGNVEEARRVVRERIESNPEDAPLGKYVEFMSQEADSEREERIHLLLGLQALSLAGQHLALNGAACSVPEETRDLPQLPPAAARRRRRRR
jgi:hypothetical protein